MSNRGRAPSRCFGGAVRGHVKRMEEQQVMRIAAV
jgi:hypothetical protein